MASAAPPFQVEEEWSPELRLLLGPDAGELLAAAVVIAGGTLESWRPRQVRYRPEHSTVVQYRVNMTGSDGDTTSETFVAATGKGLPEEGAAVFDDGENRVAVWRWQQDPHLPGLSAALDPARVGRLLDDIGVDGGTIQLRTRAYRPGQRAVVEATGRRGRLFLKVLRPAKAEALHKLHRQLSPHLPVPDSLGWSDQGVVVMTARPGQTLRQALRSASHPLPSPGAIVDLLDRFPAELAAGRPRRDLLASATDHARVIAATVPASGERAGELLEALRSRWETTPGPSEPVHGDLYEAQLLVEGGHIRGLLDVDTAGAGARVDDMANLCAHLSVLGLVSDRPKRIRSFGAAVVARAEHDHGPGVLRTRIAAAVLGLATGPFRVLDRRWAQGTMRRLELAERWLGDQDAT